MKKLLLAALLLVIPNVQATTFTYDFGFNGVAIAFDPVTGQDFHFGADSTLSTSTLVFDDVAGTAFVTASGFGDVVNTQTGAVITTGTNFSYSVSYTGVTGDPLAPNLVAASNGIGSFTIGNVGNIDGIAGNDSVSGQVAIRSSIDGTNTILSDVPGNGIQNAVWFDGIGDTLVNGSQASALFNAVGGDNNLGFGTLAAGFPTTPAEVPEPMTAALLGLGMLGGAIKRKKSQ